MVIQWRIKGNAKKKKNKASMSTTFQQDPAVMACGTQQYSSASKRDAVTHLVAVKSPQAFNTVVAKLAFTKVLGCVLYNA